jgi:hypothetical protein
VVEKRSSSVKIGVFVENRAIIAGGRELLGEKPITHGRIYNNNCFIIFIDRVRIVQKFIIFLYIHKALFWRVIINMLKSINMFVKLLFSHKNLGFKAVKFILRKE